MTDYGLAADIGGTNVRFGLVDLSRSRDAVLIKPRKLASRGFTSIVDVAKSYLADMSLDRPPAACVLAVAGPVRAGEISLTNLPWHFSESEVGSALGIGRVTLINDYEAIAMAAPFLTGSDLVTIGPVAAATPAERETVAIVGPGTGLGIAGYIRSGKSVTPMVTEGGHADFAPTDETEIAILNVLRRRHGHVSYERVLSGPGLVNLHLALAEIEGVPYVRMESHAITAMALSDPGSLAARVFGRFCAILGSMCGNVALMMGAREGLLIAGGILPAMPQMFAASAFRARFEAKGRFSEYMSAIPSRLIVQEYAGLMGSSAVLLQQVAGAPPDAIAVQA